MLPIDRSKLYSSSGAVQKDMPVKAEFSNRTLSLAAFLLLHFQMLSLIYLQVAVLPAPRVVGLLGDPSFRLVIACILLLVTATSICLKIFTIWSDVCFLALIIPCQFISSPLVQNLPGTPSGNRCLHGNENTLRPENACPSTTS